MHCDQHPLLCPQTLGQLPKAAPCSFLNRHTHRSRAVSGRASFPSGIRKPKQDAGLSEGQTGAGVSPSRQVGAKLFLPGWFLQGSGLSPELCLASTGSTISRDNAWAPRATLIPCWYPVSVMYIAVENHSSSRDAAPLMLLGREHRSSRLSQQRTLWFSCSSF